MYNLNKTSEYNLNKAKEKLIEGGWNYKNNKWIKNGRILELNLLVNKNNQNRIKCANIIKEQLNKIGIIINIIEANNNTFNNYVKNKNYDIILSGNIVSITPELSTYFGENNISNMQDQESINILTEVKNINDEEILKNRYLELLNLYTSNIPFISLYFNNVFILSNKELKGDMTHNWYNIFYNIDNWYKVENN